MYTPVRSSSKCTGASSLQTSWRAWTEQVTPHSDAWHTPCRAPRLQLAQHDSDGDDRDVKSSDRGSDSEGDDDDDLRDACAMTSCWTAADARCMGVADAQLFDLHELLSGAEHGRDIGASAAAAATATRDRRSDKQQRYDNDEVVDKDDGVEGDDVVMSAYSRHLSARLGLQPRDSLLSFMHTPHTTTTTTTTHHRHRHNSSSGNNMHSRQRASRHTHHDSCSSSSIEDKATPLATTTSNGGDDEGGSNSSHCTPRRGVTVAAAAAAAAAGGVSFCTPPRPPLPVHTRLPRTHNEQQQEQQEQQEQQQHAALACTPRCAQGDTKRDDEDDGDSDSDARDTLLATPLPRALFAHTHHHHSIRSGSRAAAADTPVQSRNGVVYTSSPSLASSSAYTTRSRSNASRRHHRSAHRNSNAATTAAAPFTSPSVRQRSDGRVAAAAVMSMPSSASAFATRASMTTTTTTAAAVVSAMSFSSERVLSARNLCVQPHTSLLHWGCAGLLLALDSCVYVYQGPGTATALVYTAPPGRRVRAVTSSLTPCTTTPVESRINACSDPQQQQQQHRCVYMCFALDDDDGTVVVHEYTVCPPSTSALASVAAVAASAQLLEKKTGQRCTLPLPRTTTAATAAEAAVSSSPLCCMRLVHTCTTSLPRVALPSPRRTAHDVAATGAVTAMQLVGTSLYVARANGMVTMCNVTRLPCTGMPDTQDDDNSNSSRRRRHSCYASMTPWLLCVDVGEAVCHMDVRDDGNYIAVGTTHSLRVYHAGQLQPAQRASSAAEATRATTATTAMCVQCEYVVPLSSSSAAVAQAVVVQQRTHHPVRAFTWLPQHKSSNKSSGDGGMCAHGAALVYAGGADATFVCVYDVAARCVVASYPMHATVYRLLCRHGSSEYDNNNNKAGDTNNDDDGNSCIVMACVADTAQTDNNDDDDDTTTTRVTHDEDDTAASRAHTATTTTTTWLRRAATVAAGDGGDGEDAYSSATYNAAGDDATTRTRHDVPSPSASPPLQLPQSQQQEQQTQTQPRETTWLRSVSEAIDDDDNDDDDNNDEHDALRDDDDDDDVFVTQWLRRSVAAAMHTDNNITSTLRHDNSSSDDNVSTAAASMARATTWVSVLASHASAVTWRSDALAQSLALLRQQQHHSNNDAVSSDRAHAAVTHAASVRVQRMPHTTRHTVMPQHNHSNGGGGEGARTCSPLQLLRVCNAVDAHGRWRPQLQRCAYSIGVTMTTPLYIAVSPDNAMLATAGKEGSSLVGDGGGVAVMRLWRPFVQLAQHAEQQRQQQQQQMLSPLSGRVLPDASIHDSHYRGRCDCTRDADDDASMMLLRSAACADVLAGDVPR